METPGDNAAWTLKEHRRNDLRWQARARIPGWNGRSVPNRQRRSDVSALVLDLAVTQPWWKDSVLGLGSKLDVL